MNKNINNDEKNNERTPVALQMLNQGTKLLKTIPASPWGRLKFAKPAVKLL